MYYPAQLNVVVCIVASTCIPLFILYINKSGWGQWELTLGGNMSTQLPSNFGVSISSHQLEEFDPDSGDGPVVHESEKKRCRKFVMLMGKRLMKYLTNCISGLRQKYPQREEFDKQFQCAIKCSMSGIKMVDEDGNLTNGTMVNFVTIHISEEYHNLVYRLSTNCLKKYSPLIVTGGHKDDPYCTSYGDFIKCIQGFVADVCTVQTH